MENPSSPNKKAWKIQGEILEELKWSANKFTGLEIHDNDVDNSGSLNKYKHKNTSSNKENDVMPNENGIAQGMEGDVIEGIDKGVINSQ